MTTDLPVYQFSFNTGFGKNGSPSPEMHWYNTRLNYRMQRCIVVCKR